MDVRFTEVEVDDISLGESLHKCPEDIFISARCRLFCIVAWSGCTKLGLLTNLVDGLGSVDSLLDEVLLQELDAQLRQQLVLEDLNLQVGSHPAHRFYPDRLHNFLNRIEARLSQILFVGGEKFTLSSILESVEHFVDESFVEKGRALAHDQDEVFQVVETGLWSA